MDLTEYLDEDVLEEAPDWLEPAAEAFEDALEEATTSSIDPRSFPDDTQIAEWTETYGTTGVKTYVLEGHPENKNCVAVYREMSMRERAMLARLEEVDEEHPGAFDFRKMLVSTCLLYPTVESYPHPAFATTELFGRIRQHGHGPLPEEEMTAEEAATQLPEHMIEDIRSARRVAQKAFEDGRYSSLYADLVVQLSTTTEGTLDIGLFNKLWGLSPGRIRDLAARVERARMDLRKAQFNVLEEEVEDPEDRQKEAERIDRRLPSPFADIDDISEGDTIPDRQKDQDSQPRGGQDHVGAYDEEKVSSEELPPDVPSREETIEDLRAAKHSDGGPSDPIPPNT